jgi:hypothetical protein
MTEQIKQSGSTEKSTNNKDMFHYEPVFRLKPVYSDAENEFVECDIKHVGYVNQNEKFGDEMVEINTTQVEQQKYGKNIHTLGEINGYDITLRVYRNNMTGYYMCNNNLLPVCSIQFMYSKSIVTGYLFNIFIYFVLDKTKNSFLKDPKSYVGARVYGKYIMILDSENELNKNVNHLYDIMCEKFAMEQVASENLENLSQDEILNRLKDIINEKKTFYKELISGKQIKYFKNMTQFVNDNLIPIYNNKHFIDVLKYAIEERNKKRAKEYKAYDKEYKIPEKIHKLTDYIDNPELIDKYLDIESD